MAVFWFPSGNSFRCHLPTIPVVPLCLFFVAVGNSFGLHGSVFWLWREISFRCYLLTYHTICAVLSVFGCCWKSGLYPLNRLCLLLVITPGTLPCTMSALDRIVVPKIKTKIVLHEGDSNFSNAVRLLAIP